MKPIAKILAGCTLASCTLSAMLAIDDAGCENIAARMKDIEVPVLVIAGETDQSMTPALLQREIVERLSDACLEVVPNAARRTFVAARSAR